MIEDKKQHVKLMQQKEQIDTYIKRQALDLEY